MREWDSHRILYALYIQHLTWWVYNLHKHSMLLISTPLLFAKFLNVHSNSRVGSSLAYNSFGHCFFMNTPYNISSTLASANPLHLCRRNNSKTETDKMRWPLAVQTILYCANNELKTQRVEKNPLCSIVKYFNMKPYNYS